MQLRRFNDKGISAFKDYLQQLRDDATLPPPFSLLQNPEVAELLEPAISAEPKTFNNRMEFAHWLHDAAETAGTNIPRRDAGFWAWLTLLLFDQVCPPKNGKRKAGEQARYTLDSNWLRQYRHLLATPYGIYHAHNDDPERTRFLMVNPLNVFGELTEQFASRQELISCPGTMSLASYLFMDSRTGKPRTGAGGDAAGRLGKLLNQYTRTWDITVMEPSDSANLLPAEFDRFRPNNTK